MPTVIDLVTLAPTEGFSIAGAGIYDKAGFSVASAGDINGDGIDDFIVSAPSDDSGGTNAGGAYVIFGKAGATRTNITLVSLGATNGFRILGDAGSDQAGWSVSSAGDINGDGIDDLIVGAVYGDNGGNDAGEAYVIFGKAGTTRADIELTILAAADGFTIQGDAANDLAGFSVSDAGDINGDGIDDLIVGAPYGDNGGSNAGEVYVIFGKAGATRANIDLTNLAAADGFIIQGDTAGDFAGFSVSSAGDINGDGIADLIVGAPYGDNGGSNAGEAYVIFGKAGTTRANIDLTSLAAADGFIIQGDAAGDQAGVSISSAGDINGDGNDDLIVGARFGDNSGSNSGEAYVIFGRAGATRANIDLTGLIATDGFIIEGIAIDSAGWSVSAAGDVDGDGYDDLIVGAPGGQIGGSAAGQASVIFGKVGATRGTVSLFDLATHQGFIIQGAHAGAQAGLSVSSAGDINGDGFADVLVGAPYTNVPNFDPSPYAPIFYNAGQAYVVYGRTALTAPGGVLNGTAVADILNGTVLADIVSGLGGSDVIYTGAGGDTVHADTSDAVLDGGSGFDTLTMSLAASLNGNFTGTIAGFEALQLNGTNVSMAAATFKAGFATNTMLTGTGSLIITMDAADPSLRLQQLQGTSGPFLLLGITINGSSAVNIVKAAVGIATTYNGGGATDQVRGSNLADTISGGNGNDKIYAAGGGDTLTGGAGNDQFRYVFASDSGFGSNRDQITDFVIGGDKLNFALMDADAVTPGDQAFSFIATAAFANTGIGQIRYQNSGADLLVQVDTDGNGTADMEIVLQGLNGSTLTSGDFLL